MGRETRWPSRRRVVNLAGLDSLDEIVELADLSGRHAISFRFAPRGGAKRAPRGSAVVVPFRAPAEVLRGRARAALGFREERERARSPSAGRKRERTGRSRPASKASRAGAPRSRGGSTFARSG